MFLPGFRRLLLEAEQLSATRSVRVGIRFVAYGVVDADRELPRRWTFYIGPDGKILAVDKKVSTSSAGEDVVAKLTALGVPKKK